MTLTRRHLTKQNAAKYEVERIEKACATTRRVANGTDSSTSTAQPTPKKRGRKPKAVPHSKRLRLEREEKKRVAAKVAAGRIAACSKLRGNSPAEHVASLRDEIVTRRAAKNPAQTKIPDTNPRRGTRSKPLMPGRDLKPIEKYVAEASPSLRDYTDRKSAWQPLQDSKAKTVDDISSP